MIINIYYLIMCIMYINIKNVFKQKIILIIIIITNNKKEIFNKVKIIILNKNKKFKW